MAVSEAPAVEAMKAIVERISSADTFCLPVSVDYGEELIDELEGREIYVSVISEEEEQLNETLDEEDRTNHVIRVWVRRKLDASTNDEIDPLKLLTRQIFQRLNQYSTSDNRVQIWECDFDSKEVPNKAILRQSGLFVASLSLRVEVEAS